jgi:hypothetical protein
MSELGEKFLKEAAEWREKRARAESVNFVFQPRVATVATSDLIRNIRQEGHDQNLSILQSLKKPRKKSIFLNARRNEVLVKLERNEKKRIQKRKIKSTYSNTIL